MRLLVSLILAAFLAETTTQYHEKRLRSKLLNINWRIARCFTLKSADASLRASRFAYRQRHAGCCLDWDRTPIDPALAGTVGTLTMLWLYPISRYLDRGFSGFE